MWEIIVKNINKKIKSYLIVIASGLFLSVFTIQCAQNRSWYSDLFLRIFAPKRYESLEQRPTAPLTRSMISETLKDPYQGIIIGGGALGSFAAAGKDNLLSVILMLPATAFAALTIVTGIIDTFHYYDNKQYIANNEKEKKEQMIQSTQNSLVLLIAQNDLYPTRSLKINALIGPDFEEQLVRYVGHKDIMIEARDRLLKTIVSIPIGDNDTIIDSYISKLREKMAKEGISMFSLDNQINYLKSKKDDKMTPAEGQGYTSLLKRLENRAKIEKNFAPMTAAAA